MPAWPKPSVTPGPQWAEMQEAFIVQYFDTESGAWKPLVIPASALKDGEITDAKIADTAAIALTKLATGILPSGIKIVDANVNEGIAQSKIAGLLADLAARVTNPMTQPGDIVVNGATGVPERLAKGADDAVLTVIAGTLGYRLIPTASLDDLAVTEAKLANEAVTPPKIQRQATGTVLKGKGPGTDVAFEALLGTDVPAATDAERGTVELATKAEMEAGTDTGRVPSVDSLKHHKGVAKAWVEFHGTGTLTVLDSYNVSSVSDDGTGLYTVNWATAFASANYAYALGCRDDGTGGDRHMMSRNTISAGALPLRAKNDTNTQFDADWIAVIACGLQ